MHTNTIKNIGQAVLQTVICLLMTGCHTESDTQPSPDPILITGEWLLQDKSAGTVADLTVDNLHFSEVIYANISSRPDTIDQRSGTWTYHTDREVLNMEIFSLSDGERQTASFTIQQIDSTAMRLRNQKDGSESVYNRVVESHTITTGEHFDIHYASAHGNAVCHSMNNGIATVSSNGHVVGSGSGVTFISVDADSRQVFVKVCVKPESADTTISTSDIAHIDVEARTDIVGEWVETYNADQAQLMMLSKYKKDGSAEILYANISLYNNMYFTYPANYTYTGSRLSLNYTDPWQGVKVTDTYTVRSIDGYSMTLYYAPTAVVENVYRVLQTRHMNVGDKITLKVRQNGETLTTAACSSNNPYVVAIDQQGNIQALRRGFAFLTLTTDRGTAAVHIEVTDPNNVIDDLASMLGQSVDVPTSIYGNLFFDNSPQPGINLRAYNLMDEMIEAVSFTWDETRTVYEITASLREDVDFAAIRRSYQQRYRDISDPDDKDFYMYLYEKDGKTIGIGMNTNIRVLHFSYVTVQTS